MNSINKTARMAGFLYFIYMLTHIISDAWRDSFIVLGDAAATASHIMAHQGLFTLTAVGDLLAAALFFLAAWALYVLLKPVNKALALLFLLLNLAGVAIQCVSAMNLFAALLLMNGPDYLKLFQVDQLQALAMFFLDLREQGFLIAQLFYGAWLFPLGYSVFKSGFLPKILGIVLMVHCFTWLSTFFQSFLFPGFTAITYVSWPLGFIAEFGLTLWLLIKGAKEQK
ncbi:MAG TPA: DUF4386 domain-containing protein [Anaerolineae bacterium]|nr:DUF4386 domain-containing protein [Anaerolineae bacterium]HQI84422.1 DUF4386 domain-containing protein [Anaerolineae bacterium]